jgi:LexA-binding, inner membrane-associated putative hydrolase
MATIGHLAVGALLARACTAESDPRDRRLRRAAAAAWMATIPDADLALRAFGVPAGDEGWAHRGASHALVIGPGVTLVAWLLGARIRDAGCYGLAIMSHGLVDTLSESERGVALLWPVRHRRFTAPLHPVLAHSSEVAWFDWRSWLPVFAREALVFSPVIVLALWPGRRAPYRGGGTGGVAQGPSPSRWRASR